MKLLKNPLFLTGFLIVAVIFFSSLIYSLAGGKVPITQYIYKNGNIVGSFPFTPLQLPPFGTDDAGNSLFYEILVGAKYTIGIAVGVSVFRVILSSLFGIILGQTNEKYNRYYAGFSNAFHYMPVVIICYLLLNNVLLGVGQPPVFPNSFAVRVLFELTILILVALPATSMLIGNDVRSILNNEYITSSRLLGGNRRHILRKHVWLHMKPKLWVYLVEQIVQILILLCHLGLIKLFFGGTTAIKLHGVDIYLSISNEWSGLIGKSYDRLYLSPWMALVPLMMFALTILAFNLILEGLKNPESLRVKKRQTNSQPVQQTAKTIPDENFTALKQAEGGR